MNNNIYFFYDYNYMNFHLFIHRNAGKCLITNDMRRVTRNNKQHFLKDIKKLKALRVMFRKTGKYLEWTNHTCQMCVDRAATTIFHYTPKIVVRLRGGYEVSRFCCTDCYAHLLRDNRASMFRDIHWLKANTELSTCWGHPNLDIYHIAKYRIHRSIADWRMGCK